jgi:hypothetical protein
LSRPGSEKKKERGEEERLGKSEGIDDEADN